MYSSQKAGLQTNRKIQNMNVRRMQRHMFKYIKVEKTTLTYDLWKDRRMKALQIPNEATIGYIPLTYDISMSILRMIVTVTCNCMSFVQGWNHRRITTVPQTPQCGGGVRRVKGPLPLGKRNFSTRPP